MRYLFVIVCACMSLSACGQNKFNPVLKRQLDSVAALDQYHREILSKLGDPAMAVQVAKLYHSTPDSLLTKLWKEQNKTDSLNVIFIEAVFKKYSYPGKTMVGIETSDAAWLVIQHSKDIPKYIPLIKAAAEKNELTFNKYAMMYDRYLMYQNKGQVYGTQCTSMQLKSGKDEMYVWPVQDAAHVNERRKKAGFTQTIEQYAVQMHIAYRVVKLDEVQAKFATPK